MIVCKFVCSYCSLRSAREDTIVRYVKTFEDDNEKMKYINELYKTRRYKHIEHKNISFEELLDSPNLIFKDNKISEIFELYGMCKQRGLILNDPIQNND